MKKLSFLFIVSFTALLSCNIDDTSEVNPNVWPENTTVWKLVNVSGSIAGVNNDFEPGVISWGFDSEINTITVVNNFDDNNGMIEDFFESGSYDYYYTENEPGAPGCSSYFVVDTTETGLYR